MGSEPVACKDVPLDALNTPCSAGREYVETLEYSTYIDNGANAYDKLDGYLSVTYTVQLCSISPQVSLTLQAAWDRCQGYVKEIGVSVSHHSLN